MNKQDSSEVLHKSQSVKMIGDTGSGSLTGNNSTTIAPTGGGQGSNLAQSHGQSSAAARMLARKNNMLNSQTAASGQINEKSRE